VLLHYALCFWTSCFLHISSVCACVRACSCKHFFPWKSSKYYIFRYYLCILGYPTFNAHALYCHTGPLWLYKILPSYALNGRIFKDNLLNVILYCECLNNVCLEYFWFWRNEWDMIKIYFSVHVKYRLFLSDLKESWNLL
jgi:hypothetical protein